MAELSVDGGVEDNATDLMFWILMAKRGCVGTPATRRHPTNSCAINATWIALVLQQRSWLAMFDRQRDDGSHPASMFVPSEVIASGGNAKDCRGRIIQFAIGRIGYLPK